MTEAQSKTYELVGRATERHSCCLKVRYRVLHSVPSMGLYHEGEAYGEGWLRNRSHGGVMMETLGYVAEGKRVELNFSSPDSKSTYRAEAIVRWVKGQGEQGFRMGLKFQELHQL